MKCKKRRRIFTYQLFLTFAQEAAVVEDISDGEEALVLDNHEVRELDMQQFRLGPIVHAHDAVWFRAVYDVLEKNGFDLR